MRTHIPSTRATTYYSQARQVALQRVAEICSVLQLMAVYCRVWRCVAICGNLREHTYAPCPRAQAHQAQAHQVVLQCVAVCCSALQYVVICGKLYEHTNTPRARAHQSQAHQVVLQCMAVCGSVLQCMAVCGSVLQCMAVCGSVLQCMAVCGSVLQCVAVYGSVWQCVAMRCSVFQFEANCTSTHTHLALEQEHISLKRSKYLSKSILRAQPPPPVTHPLHRRLSTLGALDIFCSWCTRVCACVCVRASRREHPPQKHTHKQTYTHIHARTQAHASRAPSL